MNYMQRVVSEKKKDLILKRKRELFHFLDILVLKVCDIENAFSIYYALAML